MSQAVHVWEDGEIEIAVGRTVDLRFRLFTGDKVPKAIALAAGDVVRFKLSVDAGDDEPLLDLSSAAATAGESIVTIAELGEDNVTAADVRVRFGQVDTAELADYADLSEPLHGELCLVDDSETAPADAIKRIAHGPVLIVPASGGAVGLT
jgi:hypothetical protein